ncbi:acetyltransferase [Cyclobacterium sp. 1_MG-2023]|uniref:acetyltransferase n=1 Tax=Cyclobacterium sp. 1_MG-2023 TaxID=3062681 RepID=UPI0026E1B0E4|nr:acetyltransferase [Cyclobacterium sp. 1_MG-2023]MDO6439159.1 acetyltransferase [Cyclobacterium sp. 1_MG-2023]
MVIAGAGGHAMEVLDVLVAQKKDEGAIFYDDFTEELIFQNAYSIIKNQIDIKIQFGIDPRFILGVGDGKTRAYFTKMFSSLGGIPTEIRAKSAIISSYAKLELTDVFNFCFIGANVISGKGTLINSGSQIHHETQIGQFSSINPGVQLLGKCSIGNFCSIGAGAIVLPGVKIGDNAIIGAGTVVTKNVPDNCTVVGVPGRVIKKIA